MNLNFEKVDLRKTFGEVRREVLWEPWEEVSVSLDNYAEAWKAYIQLKQYEFPYM